MFDGISEKVLFADTLTTLAWVDNNLIVVVENAGSVPIDALKLEWKWRNSDQESEEWSFRLPHSGDCRSSPFTRSLPPRSRLTFSAGSTYPTVKRQVAQLSPELFSISISSGEDELVRIDGQRIADPLA